MFRVVIQMESVAEEPTLWKACRTFVQKLKEMAKAGRLGPMLQDTSWIAAVYDGREVMMNFPSIMLFVNDLEIVDEHSELTDKPEPSISPEDEKNIVVAAFNSTAKAHQKEVYEDLLSVLDRLLRALRILENAQKPEQGHDNA